MKVKVAIRDNVWEVASCYCPQVGRSTVEKEEFYEILDRIVTIDKLLIGIYFNDYVGGETCGFWEVYRGQEVLLLIGLSSWEKNEIDEYLFPENG